MKGTGKANTANSPVKDSAKAITKKQKVVNDDRLLSLNVGDVVQLKDTKLGWIPARVEEVDRRRHTDPRILGSPQRYKLYNVHTLEPYTVASKDFKSELRLEPVAEDDNSGAANGEATEPAEEFKETNTDEAVLARTDEDRDFSGTGTIETGSSPLRNMFFDFFLKSVYTYIIDHPYLPFSTNLYKSVRYIHIKLNHPCFIGDNRKDRLVADPEMSRELVVPHRECVRVTMEATTASQQLTGRTFAGQYPQPVFEGSRDEQLKTACSLFVLGDYFEDLSTCKLAEFLPMLDFDMYGRISKRQFEIWKDSAPVQEIMQVIENYTVNASGSRDFLAAELRTRSDMAVFWTRVNSTSRRKRFEPSNLPVALISEVRSNPALWCNLRSYAEDNGDTASLDLGDDGIAKQLCSLGVEIRTKMMRTANRMVNNAIVAMVRFHFVKLNVYIVLTKPISITMLLFLSMF